MTKQEILEALAEQESGNNFLTGMLVGVGLGALVGGAVALLLAPRTGAELRTDLSARAKNVKSDLINRAQELKGRFAAREGEPPPTPDYTPPESGL